MKSGVEATSRRRVPPGSLVRRLLLWLMGPLLIIVAVTAALGGWWAQRLADQTFDRWLLDAARSLAQQVRLEDGRARLTLGGDAEAILSFDVQDRTYFSVRQGDRLVAGHADVPRASAEGDPVYFDAQVQAQAVRVVRLAVPGADPPAHVYMAETRLKRQEVRHDIQLMLIPTGFLLLVAAIAITAAVRATLGPVEALALRWLDQSHRSLDEVDARSVPRELQPLASAMNRLFARLRDVLARERRFTANAAHQIRTPLTGLQLGLSRAAAANTLEEARAVIADLQGNTQRTARLVQQLLAISRLEPEAAARTMRQAVDLCEVARGVGHAFVQAALDRHIQFDLLLPDGGVMVQGDPDLLSEALGNLIDNALRYGASGGVVRIVVDALGPALRVEDEGPGIAVDQRASMMERFVRGARPDQGPGTGLGLSIAQEIAVLHGGSLELDTTAAGGLSASMMLRPADPSSR